MTKVKKNGDSEERNRMLASVAFVTVLIIIGVPLWWKTTEVYRVSLPYAEIESLKTSPLRLRIKTLVLANDAPTAAEVAGLLQQRLAQSEVLDLEVETGVLEEPLRGAVSGAADNTAAAAAVAARCAGAVCLVQRARLAGQAWLGDEAVVLFRDAAAGATAAAVVSEWVIQRGSVESAGRARGDAARARRLPPSDHYDVTLTVAHPTPHLYKLDFPAQRALEDYIGTFLDDLSHLHNFTLRSQWVHLLEVDFKAEKVGSRHVARSAYLTHVLSPLEKRSGAGASPHTPVRLLLYALPCRLAPMYIANETGDIVSGPISGFMSARWGGVVLASPDSAACGTDEGRHGAFAPDVPLVMGNFLAHMRELVGIHKLPPIEGASLSPLRGVRARRWEITALTHTRTLERISCAVSTLASIAQLLDEIPNIVINDEVGASIRLATSAAGAARLAAAAGDAAAPALAHSAARAAERAFTSPSLLALLYFPDDQKYAVYIPLFLPVMIPVLISLRNIVLWLRGRRKEKSD